MNKRNIYIREKNKENYSQLNIRIPKKLKKNLDLYLIKNDLTLRGFIIELLEKNINNNN